MSDWKDRYQAYLRSPEWREKRTQVLARANGVCESCGAAFATEVHHTTYDHVFDEPLWELRAVCRACHEMISEADGVEISREERKSEVRATTEAKRMSEFRPREWQKRGADECVSRAKAGADRALVYACPGAGKTYAALLIAQALITRGRCETHEIIVVTPNLAIKSQWIERARVMGIALDEVKGADDLSQMHLASGSARGLILGYQQVINYKHSLRAYCQAARPIVILDEVHHTAGAKTDRDGNAWGTAVEYAFQRASFKLPTTGTPFREGNDPIAFVDYNEAGEATATIRYTYRDAITEGICRQVEFVFFDGWIEWETKGGRQVSADFAKKLNKRLAKERLDAALSPDGEFPLKMLAAADKHLTELRAGGGTDAAAGGLVVAIDIEHANAIADALEVITGERPVVVHNKIDEAQAEIAKFRDGTSKWIVGISMISEGVDIPRLRVGVYATVKRAALYFHQFVGRFLRVQESPTERSFVFLPSDPEIEAMAREIEKERYHAIGEEPPLHRKRRGNSPGLPAGIEVLGSDSDVVSNMAGGIAFPVEYQRQHSERVRTFRLKDPQYATWTDAKILKLLVDAEQIQPPPQRKAG